MALTKSRFTLAVDCATRLYFYDHRERYVDAALEDEYLQALALGGYQVGALAQVQYAGGELIDDESMDRRVARTRALLAREHVILYEAAIAHGDLLVLVDVLEKRGEQVWLREVKAKSYDADEDGDLRGKRGALSKDFLPYLRDIAFQHHCFTRAYPQLRCQPVLVFANKAATASVDGLNQRFRIRRKTNGRAEVVVVPGTDASTIGTPLLAEVAVDAQVAEIQRGTLRVGDTELPFADAVARLALAHTTRQPIWTPPGRACGDCRFRAAPTATQASGFRECWSHAYGWTEADFAEPTVLDLYKLNHTHKDRLFAARRLKLRQLTDADLAGDDEREDGGMTLHRRRLLQIESAKRSSAGRGAADTFDAVGYAAARRQWRWPLNFIDFETCTVAIPFKRGRRPYEQIAFQFSHHVMHPDGRVEHRTQFLKTDAGVFPNYMFVRALREALSSNDGTIFRWHQHENTVLTQIREQLHSDPLSPDDRDALIAFIDHITTRGEGKNKRHGPRTMVDLCEIAERFYFHPSTQGSSSLKKVLPALMQSSAALRERYSAPVYGIGCAMPSLNYAEPIAWWQQQDGTVIDPYRLLPPLFEGMSLDEQERLEWALPEGVQDGGAAMTAYARLQFEDMPAPLRAQVNAALLRYCELDTLAMVMAVQAWDAMAGA